MTTLVTLSHLDTQAAELDATVDWRVPVGREAGAASVFLPRTHPLFASDCWTERGGFSVRASAGAAGAWTGVATTVRVDREGARIDAVDLAGYAALRTVGSPLAFRYATAGVVASVVIRDALTGLAAGAFVAGAFAEAAPVLPDFDAPAGRTLGDVMADLSEKTGQEWRVGADGKVHWGPPFGAVYPGWLADPGDVRDVSWSVDASAVVSSVTATGPTGRSYTAQDAAVADVWPASAGVTVETDDLGALALAAEAELARRREPVTTYSFALHPRHHAVREGDTVRLILPYAGVAGQTVSARVLHRRWDGTTLTAEARRVSDAVPPRLSGWTVQKPASPPAEGDYLRRLADLRSRLAAVERRAI